MGQGPSTDTITAVGLTQWTVSDHVYKVTATLYGASGATVSCSSKYGYSGKGAIIAAEFAVYVYVGGQATATVGGSNGGGNPGSGDTTLKGGGGGGATDIRRYPYQLEDRLLVAGGGGTFTGRQTAAEEVIPMELREVQEMARTHLAVEAQRRPEVPLALLAQLQVRLEQVLQYVECLEVAEAEIGMVAEQASRPVAGAAPVTIQAL